MVQIAQIADADVVLKKTGVPPTQFDPPQFTPERMGITPLARLQIPTNLACNAEVLRVLDDLVDQIRQLRRENFSISWHYAHRVQILVRAANLRLREYTKSSGQK